MMNKIILLGLVLLFFRNESNAQQTKVLTVGDTVPEILIRNIINDKIKSAKLSDYKNKLLILDFGGTSCGQCVLALPGLDSLQQIFGEKIKILPVTYENEGVVRKFYKTNRHAKLTTLPSVVEDTILNKTFKHYSIPFEVWIYKGVIIALTDDKYVTKKNIDLILQGKRPDWPVVMDHDLYDPKRGVFSQTVPDNSIRSYSILSAFKRGFHYPPLISSILDTNTRIRTNTVFNRGIEETFLALMNRTGKRFKRNRVVYKVDHPDRYRYQKASDPEIVWYEKNAVFYESRVCDSGQGDAHAYHAMMNDLSRLLNIRVYVDSLNIKCLELVPAKTIEAIRPIKTHMKKHVLTGNISVDRIVPDANYFPDYPPMFNETGRTDRIVFDYDSWNDLNAYKLELKKHGIDLVEKMKRIEMVVIEEIKRTK